MKELVAGNYFVKKESVLLYLVIEGIGTFLKIAKAIVLENPTTYSETDILLDFQKNPDAFIIVEESNIWPKPEVKSNKRSTLDQVKEKILPKTKEYTEDDIPELDELYVKAIKMASLEIGRVETIQMIIADHKVDRALAEMIYQKYA